MYTTTDLRRIDFPKSSFVLAMMSQYLKDDEFKSLKQEIFESREIHAYVSAEEIDTDSNVKRTRIEIYLIKGDIGKILNYKIYHTIKGLVIE